MGTEIRYLSQVSKSWGRFKVSTGNTGVERVWISQEEQKTRSDPDWLLGAPFTSHGSGPRSHFKQARTEGNFNPDCNPAAVNGSPKPLNTCGRKSRELANSSFSTVPHCTCVQSRASKGKSIWFGPGMKGRHRAANGHYTPTLSPRRRLGQPMVSVLA